MITKFRSSIIGAAVAAMSFGAAVASADTVTLSGSVASIASVEATDTVAASALDMGGEGVDEAEKIVKVADVALNTNNASGLTLTVTSGNLANGAEVVAYKVTTVADAATAPLTGAFSIASGTNYTHVNAIQGSENRDLYISYDPPKLLDPGSYSATITLTVADN